MIEEEENDPLNEAPMLRSLKGRPDPFVVPDGFFDRFPNVVQQCVAGKRSSFPLFGYRWAALVIGVTVAAMAIWWALPVKNAQVDDPLARSPIDISPDELPIDEYAIWEIYTDPTTPLFEDVSIVLDETELIAYLEHENIDVELLILEP